MNEAPMATTYQSPALQLPGAVPPPDHSVDSGVPWHYGDPHGEQRLLAAGAGVVDLSHRGVLQVIGPDRLTWLHSLTTQALEKLLPNMSTSALILDPHGHVEHELHLVDDGEKTWIIVEAAATEPLRRYLDSMRFMLRVEVVDVSADFAVVWQPLYERHVDYPTWLSSPEFSGIGTSESGTDRGGDASKYIDHRPEQFAVRETIIPRADLPDLLQDRAGELAGTWAYEALRVAAGVPRVGLETDHRTLPHEVGWIGPAVHLSKGCYRGQEAIARVHNMGKPPRRLVLLHLDGGAEILPEHGDAVYLGDRQIGWVGSAARHYELGPIATAIIKRSINTDTDLIVMTGAGESVAASAESIITS